jgi:hypothetical protein
MESPMRYCSARRSDEGQNIDVTTYVDGLYVQLDGVLGQPRVFGIRRSLGGLETLEEREREMAGRDDVHQDRDKRQDQARFRLSPNPGYPRRQSIGQG